MTPPRDFVNSVDLIPQGLLRSLYQPVRPWLERVCGFNVLNKIYARLQTPEMTPQRFCVEGLQHLGAAFTPPTEEELHPLRAWQGPLVIMCNHPFGGAEALALMLLLERLRPDGWRMFANRILAPTPELAPHLIAVDPFLKSNAANRQGITQARRFLAEGGLLGAFPAGRVSAWHRRQQSVLDLPWSDHPARLAAACGAAVVLLHVPGSNSRFFLNVPLRWPRLRALFLPREMICPDKPAVSFHVGPVMEPATIINLVRTGNPGAKLRARCHLLPEIRNAAILPAPALPPPAEITGAGDAAALHREVGELSAGPAFLFAQGRFTALLFQRRDALHLFHELSRQRETAFRASGQGGGASMDITPEDDYYHQLVLWDRDQQRLVGAYRLGFTEEVLGERGQQALYLNHVFHIQPQFFQRIGPAIELTRSFIHPGYQRDPLALALLWRGLGMAVAARPRIRSLFGCVTIPATVSDASRAVIVEYLRRHHAEDSALRFLIRARSPFKPPGIAHQLVAEAHGEDPIETLRDCIRTPDGTPCPIPPLIRHYLSMNARFFGFHIEKQFGNALYCLLRVDLAKAPNSHLRRFVGEAATARLLGW